MNIIKCPKCGKEKEHKAKGVCHRCYVKYYWKQRQAKCTRCKKVKPIHAKELCVGCYNFVYFLDKTKERNQIKNYGLEIKTYKKITEKCVLCGFDKVVDLHHLDENKKNNSVDNFVGLCPNHHRMLHNFDFREEILEKLKQKGFNIPFDEKVEFQTRIEKIK